MKTSNKKSTPSTNVVTDSDLTAWWTHTEKNTITRYQAGQKAVEIWKNLTGYGYPHDLIDRVIISRGVSW